MANGQPFKALRACTVQERPTIAKPIHVQTAASLHAKSLTARTSIPPTDQNWKNIITPLSPLSELSEGHTTVEP